MCVCTCVYQYVPNFRLFSDASKFDNSRRLKVTPELTIIGEEVGLPTNFRGVSLQGATTLGRTTFSIMTLRITIKNATPSIIIFSLVAFSILTLENFMLSVANKPIVLIVIMLRVVMLNMSWCRLHGVMTLTITTKNTTLSNLLPLLFICNLCLTVLS